MASITWDAREATNRPRREPLDYVDTLIGTAELGNTFPAVCLPFGLAKWTPQTVAGEHKGQPPYSYEHRRIQGIRWTNFISGSAVPDYGSMTVMALVGDLRLHPEARASAFSHDREIATPYAYAVTLDDYAVRAEVTTTERAGFLRFTFPRLTPLGCSCSPTTHPARPIPPATRMCASSPSEARSSATTRLSATTCAPASRPGSAAILSPASAGR